MMKSEMVKLLRQHLSDEQSVGWPQDSELLAYLDRAADFMSEELIAVKDPTLLKQFEVLGTAPLPADFVAFAGNVPVCVIGRECEFYGDFPIDVLYWGKFPSPSKQSETEALPYTHEQIVLIVDIARVFALNKNEYDISQDMALLANIQQSIAASRTGRA